MIDLSVVPVETVKGYTFQCEHMADVLEEMQEQHRMHWEETEGFRHGLPLDYDYARWIAHENIDKAILFTLRKDGELVGNCGVYLYQSMHTKTLAAKEDTWFIRADHRGRVSFAFTKYFHAVLKAFGVKEITLTVKTTNRAGKFAERCGYRPVAVEYWREL